MTEPTRRRFLRPGSLLPVGTRVWVVDEQQPVALVLDEATAAEVALVGWPQTPAGRSPERRVVMAGADGLWVQQHEGPLVLVSPSGEVHGRYVSDAVLGAVSAHGAWCAPEPRAQDLAAAPEAPPSDDRTSARLRLACRDRSTRTVRVDAPVQSLRAIEGDLFVEVETGAWTRRALGTPTSWDLEPETSWLRLAADQDVPDLLSTATHGCDAPPHAEAWGRRYRDLPRPRDLTRSDAERARPHARTAGLDWFVGADPDATSDPGQLLALALEAGTVQERWRSPLAPEGQVVTAAATSGHLWVAVRQRRAHDYSSSFPTQVVRVDAATGHAATVVGADSIDITHLAWPLGPPPVDAHDYTTFWAHHLGSLDAFWKHTDGHLHPLSEGLSGTRADVVGDWPDTTLHVTFRWTQRPGVRLRRVVELYDGLGRAQEPRYADIHIMEDLDTRHVPDSPAPGSDHLDF